ncbi:MAG: hypothetical protein H7Y88_05770 [Phycisphaerales bacterium]|nr:hypothetical protein [Phycisphaerales bacterium]
MNDWLLIANPRLCWLLVAIATALFIRGLFCDRARGRRRCPRCWYDMAGLTGLTCPECGKTVQRERALHRSRRSPRLMLAALLLLGVAVTPVAYQAHARYMKTRWRMMARHTYGQWEAVRRHKASAGLQEITLRHGGRVCFRLSDFWVDLGDGPTVFADVTGNGVPDLIISTHNGGNSHTFESHYVLELDPEGVARPLAVLPHGGFVDLDYDGVPEFVTTDKTFAYWWTGGGNSPYPRVVLRASDEGYTIDTNLMRAQRAYVTDIEKLAATFRSSTELNFSTWVSDPLEVALRYIYTGYETDAWHLLDCAWPPRFAAEKESRLAELRDQLKLSPYAGDVTLMQHSDR